MSQRYTDEEKSRMIELVLELMSDMTAPLACKEVGVPVSTFRGWIEDGDKELADRYARARTSYIDKLAGEILSISDEKVGETERGGSDTGAVQRNRLRVDSRKWLLSKLAPKKYGDRLMVAGDEDNPLVVTKIERKVVDERSEDSNDE